MGPTVLAFRPGPPTWTADRTAREARQRGGGHTAACPSARLSFGAREVGDHAVCSTDPDRTSYPETHALQDIHFEITQGEYVAISGPSGCGETTLLSILGLLDTPSDGNYLLDGHQVAKLVPVERARFRSRIAICLPSSARTASRRRSVVWG